MLNEESHEYKDFASPPKEVEDIQVTEQNVKLMVRVGCGIENA